MSALTQWRAPELRGVDAGAADPQHREPAACDNLSLDAVAGLAQALALGIDETRRLLAANQPEDWIC